MESRIYTRIYRNDRSWKLKFVKNEGKIWEESMGRHQLVVLPDFRDP